ncbi:hypothetical protein OFB94_29410, partial [Escherichia coli]|nr:hypothetical protein [Escherichia coli]
KRMKTVVFSSQLFFVALAAAAAAAASPSFHDPNLYVLLNPLMGKSWVLMRAYSQDMAVRWARGCECARYSCVLLLSAGY